MKEYEGRLVGINLGPNGLTKEGKPWQIYGLGVGDVKRPVRFSMFDPLDPKFKLGDNIRILFEEYQKDGMEYPSRTVKNIILAKDTPLPPVVEEAVEAPGANLLIKPVLTGVTEAEILVMDKIRALGKPITETDFIFTMTHLDTSLGIQNVSMERAQLLWESYQNGSKKPIIG